MKHLWFCMVLFSCLQQVKAQYMPLDRKRHADSLEQVMRTAPSDSLKARAAYLLSEYWSKQDTAKAKPYLEKGKALAGNSPYARALYYYYVGQVYFKTRPDLSEKAYLKADSIMTANNQQYPSAYALLTAVWYNYAVLQQLKDDTEAVISILSDKVIVYARKAGRYEQLPDYYNAVGVLLDNELEFDRAAPYFKEALSMLDTLPMNAAQQAYIISMAVDNFLSRDQLTEAGRYQKRVKQLLEKFHESVDYIEYLKNEARYLRKSKQYEEALQRIDEGIALAKRIGIPYDVEIFQHVQAMVLAEQGKHREAKDLLLAISRQPTAPFVTTRIQYYQDLAAQFAALGDFKQAYYWNQRYTTTSDSLNKAKLKEKLLQFETKFKAAEAKLEITTLKAQKTEAELQIRNNKLFIWVLGLGCLVLLLMAGISFLYYRAQKRLAAQEAFNHAQQVKELEQQRELAVTKAVLDGEDRERRRIARDLHDGLGGLLSGVKLNLTGWAAGIRPIPKEAAFQHVVKQLDHAVTELRRIAHNMMPEALLKLGFEAALHDLSQLFTNNDVQVHFEPFRLQKDNSPQLQATIYRIAQELLTNAVRHGQATRIILQCSQQDSKFLITIEDNGIGFDQAVPGTREGIGLTNIRNRVSYFRGKMELISAPGDGTSVHIELQDHH